MLSGRFIGQGHFSVRDTVKVMHALCISACLVMTSVVSFPANVDAAEKESKMDPPLSLDEFLKTAKGDESKKSVAGEENDASSQEGVSDASRELEPVISPDGNMTADSGSQLVKEATLITNVRKIGPGGSVILEVSPHDMKISGADANDIVSVKLNDTRYVLPIEGKKKKLSTFWGRARITATKNGKYMRILRENQNFAKMEGIDSSVVGTEVSVKVIKDEGYDMERKKVSKDDLEVAANFRCSKVGDMADGVIYRGHSPVDPKYHSVMCMSAAKMTRSVKIGSMINMNQNIQDVTKEMEETKGGSSPYYMKLLSTGNVSGYELDGTKSNGGSFRKGMKKHLEFMLSHDGPYYIHCRMGKDRTGFMVALLEALAGATYDEIGEDYAKTYRNYFGIKKGSAMDEYNKTDGATAFLGMMDPGVGTKAFKKDKKGVLTREAAETYMYGLGMSYEDVELLRGIVCGNYDEVYDELYGDDDDDDWDE